MEASLGMRASEMKQAAVRCQVRGSKPASAADKSWDALMLNDPRLRLSDVMLIGHTKGLGCHTEQHCCCEEL